MNSERRRFAWRLRLEKRSRFVSNRFHAPEFRMLIFQLQITESANFGSKVTIDWVGLEGLAEASRSKYDRTQLREYLTGWRVTKIVTLPYFPDVTAEIVA